MSHPNTDRDERVRQIQDTLATMRKMRQTETTVDGYVKIYINHVSRLLSLLDSQAAEMFALRKEVAASERYQALLLSQPDAATRMREACVDAIKTLRATPHGAAYNNAINDAIHKVESLTLEQGEQEKRCTQN